jgi:hypothetical protein
MVRLRKETSGCLRTLAGARQVATLHSYLSAAAKHGLAALDPLTCLARGCPWLPALA